MAEQYIKKIRTEVGDLQIDYESLANLPDLSKYATTQSVNDAKALISKVENEMSTLDDAVVKSIANIKPDDNGNVVITPASIGAATSDHTHTPASIGAAGVNHDHNTWSIEKGGTGATTAEAARRNLGALAMDKKTVTLSTSGWSSSAPYQQTVSVSGVTVNDALICDLSMNNVTTNTAEDLQEAWCYIDKIEYGNGTITATCYTEKPGVELTINVLVLK